MKKKQHWPVLVRRLIPLTECPSCHGVGLILGVFHRLECIGCHSSGFVHAETLEPLPMQDLVIQLGLEVRRSRSQLSSSPAVGGPQAQYEQNNRRGAGGSNFTGD